jgi:DNA-3-methyladenine glycosylase
LLNRRNKQARPIRDAVLPRTFFERPAANVARDLLGKNVVRLRGASLTSSMIVETEAYEGTHDIASHSSRGRTPRTEVMFGAAGRLYVYRIYGIHWMLNVVTGEVGDAAAVLIRGIEGVASPGRVAAALKIDGSLHGREATPATGLWFDEPVNTSRRLRVRRTPRIGVDYAGPIWAAKKLRFVLE